MGCGRGTFMMGGQTGEAPYLTANNGLYYIDTNAQGTGCIKNLSQVYTPGMTAGNTYALYQLFAQPDTSVSFQLYVGPSFDPTTEGAFIRVFPHNYDGGLNGNNLWTTAPITATGTVDFDASSGVLTLTLDNRSIAGEYEISSADPNTRCAPSDLCQYDQSSGTCTVADTWQGTDLESTIGAACSFWAMASSGIAPATQGLTLVDCPSGGCIGYRFTLPSGFTAKSYDQVGYGLATCFPNSSAWNVPMTLVDSACTAPPAPSGFCGQ